MKDKITYAILGSITLIAIFVAVYAWFFKDISGIAPVGHYTNAPIESEAKNIPKQEVIVKHVIAYDKKTISAKLGLPKEISDDAKQQIIANANIKPSERPQSAVTTLNTETGEARILTAEKPYPLIEFQDKKEIGVRYGYSSEGSMAGDVFGRWTFLRIKGVNMSLYGEIEALQSGKTKAKAMVEASYRW